MYNTYLWKRGYPAVIVLLLCILIPGCSSDSPTRTPVNPNLTMSMECNSGLLGLTIQNTGGAMSQPGTFVLAFEDGHADTLMLSLGADSTSSCPVSNIHGDVMATSEEWSLQESANVCLADHIQGILANVDLGAMVPSPFAQQQVLLCTYTTYIEQLTSDPPTVELTKREGGLTVRVVYANISANLRATSPGFLCPDLSGSVTIASIVISLNIDIVEGENPTVTAGTTTTAVNGFAVHVDGAFGFIVDTIVGWFQNSFVTAIQNAVSNALSEAAANLNQLIIVNSGCPE